MLGVLTDSQIAQILQSQLIGRLGIVSEGKVYILPVAYAFDGHYIYAHSREGLKIKLMRKNPSVCFQVDSIESLSSWRSVLIWGNFEELKTPQSQKAAAKLLKDRFDPMTISSTLLQPKEEIGPPKVVEKKLKAIYFRIQIKEMSGRFEKPGQG